jgi:hypothetical protein
MAYDPYALSSSSFATAIAPYLTSASAALGTYLTSASFATAISPYITSNSASIALATKLSSASFVTAIAPYLTSASAALGTYLTSSSFATAISPYITSSSVATALAPYLTSASAATLVAPYITSASTSAMYGYRTLGSGSVTGASQIKVSGTWTDNHVIQVFYYGKGAATTTNPILFLYTDGGTTPFLTYQMNTFSATASDIAVSWQIIGANTKSGLKVVQTTAYRVNGLTTQPALQTTATATTGAINCIGVCLAAGATTLTQSSAFAYVRGII